MNIFQFKSIRGKFLLATLTLVVLLFGGLGVFMALNNNSRISCCIA